MRKKKSSNNPKKSEKMGDVVSLEGDEDFNKEINSLEGMFYEGFFKEDRLHMDQACLYYRNGQVMYEGDLVLGKREGYGKFYNEDGSIIYDGFFSNNNYLDGNIEIKEKKFNLGDSLSTNFVNFKGSFKCEVVNGGLKFGVLKNLENSSRVMGNFKQCDKFSSYLYEVNCDSIQEQLNQVANEELTTSNNYNEFMKDFFQLSKGNSMSLNPCYYYLYKYLSFCNEVQDDLLTIFPNGFCKFYNALGHMIYVGNCKNGRPEGKGMLYSGENHVLRAKGNFKNGKLSGKSCKLYDVEGQLSYLGAIMPKYIGLFSKDLINSRDGFGLEFWKNGKARYKGKFYNDSRNGNFGMAYCQNGALYYVGGYEDGKFSGDGVCYWDGNYWEATDMEKGHGLRAIGTFKAGLLHGENCAIFDRMGR